MTLKPLDRVWTPFLLAAVMSAVGAGQERSAAEMAGGPLTSPPVVDAPFSAEATTKVSGTLDDGTPVEQAATARYYRDALGRVRVEQDLPSGNARSETATPIRITIDANPGSRMVYTVDPRTRTIEAGSREAAAIALGGGRTFALPLGGVRFLVYGLDWRSARLAASIDTRDEGLGARQIEGIATFGTRVALAIPAAQIGNGRPVEIVDERWESPQLKLLIRARHFDSRRGVIEYRVANIRRAEPAAELFVMPPDYAPTRGTPQDPELSLVGPNGRDAGRWVREQGR